MAISFNSIPVDIRTPGSYVEFDASRASQGLPIKPHKILVVGQRLAGTVEAGVPTLVTSADQAIEHFGRGSMLARQFAALKAVNDWTESWAVALDDLGGGATAAGEILFGGTITAAGTLYLYIAGQRLTVGVAADDEPDDVATAVAAAIVAAVDLPVTAAVDGETDEQVNVTARHKGEAGNSIDIRVNYFQGERLPAGLTVAITAMADGTGNPETTAVFTAIGDEQYDTIVHPYTDASNLGVIEDALEERWGPMVQKEGVAVTAATGNLSTLTTLGTGRNSQLSVIAGLYASPTPPWEIAAALGGAVAYYGSIDPARPFQTLELRGVKAPAIDDRFTRSERNILLNSGIATMVAAVDGTVSIERVVTTFQTNSWGLPDTAYLDLNTVMTLAYLRFSLRARVAQRFPRYKLVDDASNVGPGQAVVSPGIIRAELISLMRDWERAGLAEGVEQFKADLIVERDGSDPNRVNALIPPDLVNQFRVFAASIQFRL